MRRYVPWVTAKTPRAPLCAAAVPGSSALLLATSVMVRTLWRVGFGVTKVCVSGIVIQDYSDEKCPLL